jgi:hypothetical protein
MKHAVVPTLLAAALAILAATPIARSAQLIGHWTFDEGTGTLAADSSGNGLDGILTGPGVTWTPGALDTALNFDNSLDFIVVGHQPILIIDDSLSLSLWVRGIPDNQGTPSDPTGSILYKVGHVASTGDYSIAAQRDGNGALTVGVQVPGAWHEIEIPGVLDGTWHHVTVTIAAYPSFVLRGYRDGVLAGEHVAAPTYLISLGGPLLFGARMDGGVPLHQFTGDLDDVRLYHGVLSDSDICVLANSAFGSDCDNNGVPDVCELESNDCNNNGVHDRCDILDGTSTDCNGNWNPDECELPWNDCNDNGLHDSCEIADGSVTDCNGNGHPDECELSGNDCNGNGLHDACDILSGASDDCNANLIPDECEPDCNGNGVADECDIADGSSADCNANAVPDECEIAGNDCNANGVLDTCDIADQTSSDCNDNNLPDECEPGDCNANGILDVCDIADGTSNDCNVNGIPDLCDLADGTSEDCDADGIPDECGKATTLLAADYDDGEWDLFGDAVAIDGDLAVVTAPADDDLARDAGAAYVFQRSGDGWLQVAKLTASDGAQDDEFGWGAAVSGDTIMVGAWAHDGAGHNNGAVYVFREVGGTWQQVQKLVASDPDTTGWFGLRIALQGDTALIGAPSAHDADGVANGAAYVFRRISDTWQEVARLTPTTRLYPDYFGHSVALDGDTAVIGANGDDAAGDMSGAAYVFREIAGAWQQVARLTAADAFPGDYFGLDCAISGGTVLVGARYKDDEPLSSGAAYVFEEVGGAWQQVQKLLASDIDRQDNFGSSVAIAGDLAVIGARYDETAGRDRGSAYVFQRIDGVWQEIGKLYPPPSMWVEGFGWRSALTSDHGLIVGAPVEAGSAFIFEPFVLDDIAALASFRTCLAGPSNPNPGCDPGDFAAGDLDGDDDSDLADLALFQDAFGSPCP